MVVTATTVRRAAVVAAGCVLTAVMVVGLVDQQLNGANPRLYDFKGAFDRIAVDAEPGDLVVYEPNYLSEVVHYYGPGLESQPASTPIPDGTTVWVVATEKVLAEKNSSAKLGTLLAELEQTRTVDRPLDVPERHRLAIGAPHHDARSHTAPDDPRLQPPTWHAEPLTRAQRVRASLLALVSTVALVVYFHWLLRPDRIGNPVLFGLLLVAELFNVAAGARVLVDVPDGPAPPPPPLDVDRRAPAARRRVHPDLQRAGRGRRGDDRRGGADARGATSASPLLDDGDRAEMRQLAQRWGARYIRRDEHVHAKAGNINHALPAPTPRSCSSSTATTCRTRTCSSACCPSSSIRGSPTCSRRSTTPTAASTGSPARRGASRRCSSGRSPAARTPTAR